jgi:hypothetical protein
VIYQWKPGAFGRADAQKVGERIETIQREHGGAVTPESLVIEARDKKSPLHPCFEWDDRVAATTYRIEQARYILRSLTVSSVHEDSAEPTRAFVAVRDEDDNERRVYRHAAAVMQSPVLRDQVIHDALRELSAWRRKYAGLQELAEVFETIDRQTEMELVA